MTHINDGMQTVKLSSIAKISLTEDELLWISVPTPEDAENLIRSLIAFIPEKWKDKVVIGPDFMTLQKVSLRKKIKRRK